MDPELPCYFRTANKRYIEWEEELPSFNERPDVDDDQDATNHPLRLNRLTINQREDSSIFTAGRSFLPTRNQTTIRQRIHRPVVGGLYRNLIIACLQSTITTCTTKDGIKYEMQYEIPYPSDQPPPDQHLASYKN